LVDHFDWIIIAAILILTFSMVRSAGPRRGVELMPWPDGLEYAASGMNLAAGRGAVLHFGGYTYPSRYTGGYPLILAFFHRFYGREFRPPNAASILGMLSVFAVFMLTRGQFWRLAATVAALLLVLSPVFITYSSLAMSDVPTLFVTICAAAMLVASGYATQSPGWVRRPAWLLFGFFAGFSTIIRPSNATVLVGLAVCVAMVPLEKRDLPSLLRTGIAIAVGFAIPVAWQMHQNSINLGSAFASGYSWWVPEVYGAGGKTFSVAYLFGPTMPRNPHGNVLVYAATLLGLDGMLGDRGDLRFFMYPFAAAAFAAIGIVIALRDREQVTARRVVWFGVGYLTVLFALYAVYIFTDVAFILPGAFVLFLGAGYGIAASNRWMRVVFANSKRNASVLAGMIGVLALDALLIVSLLTEFGSRLAASPAQSEMVPALASLEQSLPPDATIVTNISLQFLELYLPGSGRQFIGLNDLDPGESFTDYHLRRLYEKRVAGWNGVAPPVLFDKDEESKPVLDALAAAIGNHAPVLVLLAAPQTPAYADTLKHELDALQTSFSVEPVGESRAIAIYQLSQHR
jgi:4-amino-4-deoxy-L-arabinose transferase-like glycosyltransferase